MNRQDTYNKWGEIATQKNKVDPKFYHFYRVKRGLRNADGTGVLAGLTTVSQVRGYEKRDEEIVPVEGRLFYRGIDIKDLIEGFEQEKRFGFDETVYLLLFGKLPSEEELAEFAGVMGELRTLPLNFPRDVLQTFRTRDVMNALTRSMLTLYSIDEQADELSVPNQVRQAMELISKINTLVPYAYYSMRQAFFNESLIIHSPDPKLCAAGNFLRLLRPNTEFTELEAKTLDVALILHADHGGGNNSTFTMRVTTSTMTDFYSSAAAALGSLKGPLHGGASGRVASMMANIRDTVGLDSSDTALRDYLFKILRGESYDKQGKLYGLGHAVYTLSDPRAEILREYARKLAKEKGREDEFNLFQRVETIGREAVLEHKNNPAMTVSSNVDFYSGFVYDCLGIPQELYTPLFAVARMVGWSAHRLELMSTSSKLMRPAYKSLGKDVPYIPMNQRVTGQSEDRTPSLPGHYS